LIEIGRLVLEKKKMSNISDNGQRLIRKFTGSSLELSASVSLKSNEIVREACFKILYSPKKKKCCEIIAL
jgi:hypothetical protein